MRQILKLLPAFMFCASCAAAPKMPDEDLTFDPITSPIFTTILNKFAQRKSILEDQALPQIDKLIRIVDIDREIDGLASSFEPENIKVGQLLAQVDLTNNHLDDIEPANQNSALPLSPYIEKMNKATNHYSGLDLPSPSVWLVQDLGEKMGRFGLYKERGDIILIDSQRSKEEMLFILASEFGSRTTNKLFEQEEANSNRIENVISQLHNPADVDPQIEALFFIITKKMRECELAESAIAVKLMQEVAPEVDVDYLIKTPEVHGLTDEDSTFIHENIEFADHPSLKMTHEFITTLKAENFFENNSYPAAETSYSCNIPFVPSGMK